MTPQRPRRGPIKNQALRVLIHRRVPVGTVLDVGVQTATPELRVHFPNTPHVLFEPVVEFNPSIERNYQGVPHQIVNAAVSDESGETLLDLVPVVDIAGYDYSHSYVASEKNDDRVQRTVPKIALDDFVRDRVLAEPFLLKIDIDGHELAAIAGSAETLKKCSIVIVEAQVEELPQRIAAIAAHGFVLFDLAEPCYYDNALWQCDAILIRRDIHRQAFAQLADQFEPSKYTMFTG